MGKQIKENKQEIEQEQQHNRQVGKKALNHFLPHGKYISMRQKIYKKRLSNAIKSIPLDKVQIKKAVDCLCKYADENNNPTDLALKHEYLYLEVIVSKIPEQHSVRPIQVKLPFPIYSSQYKSRYTVITSDEIQDQFTEKIDSLNTPMLRQILSYQKVKKNFKQLKDKRQLLAANDLFFCDWKIYNLLRQPLGKLFYQQKKYPYPIDCNGQVPQNLKDQYKDYESYINGLAGYTYTTLGNGPVYSIKIGKTRMTARQLVKNIMHGSYSLIANILDNTVNPSNIRQICIKTFNSPSLPIYNYLTQEQIAAYKKS